MKDTKRETLIGYLYSEEYFISHWSFVSLYVLVSPTRDISVGNKEEALRERSQGILP